MPQTIVELGQKVKAKYPGQYDDLADAEVGARVKAKYPDAYGDFADVAAKPAAPMKPVEAGIGDILSRFGSPTGQPETLMEKLKRATAKDPNVLTGDEPTGNTVLDILNSVVSPSSVIPTTGVGRAIEMIPKASRAAETFDTILNAARKVPLNTAEMAKKAGEVETATRFGNLPPVIKKFILAHTNSEAITYEAGRNLIKNVADAAESLSRAGKNNISRLVNEFGDAVKTANRGAAEKVGMGELYDQAVKEYRQAKTIEEAAATLKKYGIKAAISALLGSAATAAGYGVYRAVR